MWSKYNTAGLFSAHERDADKNACYQQEGGFGERHFIKVGQEVPREHQRAPTKSLSPCDRFPSWVDDSSLLFTEQLLIWCIWIWDHDWREGECRIGHANVMSEMRKRLNSRRNDDDDGALFPMCDLICAIAWEAAIAISQMNGRGALSWWIELYYQAGGMR
jgi:hypothetical protein